MSECILWPKAVGGKMGYGQQWIEGKLQRAHRVAWGKVNGSIPAGLFVLHKCDVPACINPDHLFLGTKADNNVDRAAKGRNAAPKKKEKPDMTHQNPFARWFAQQSYHTTQAGIARQIGCDRSYVTMLMREQLDIMPSLPMAMAIENLTMGEVTAKAFHDFILDNRRAKAKEAA